MPRTTKEMVDSLRASAQAGLQARISRMRVEMPDAFEFGVEGGKKKRSKIVTADGIVRSDRELARLFVEMFAGTGLRPLVLFPEASHAEQARRKWASSTEADIRALGGAKKRSKPAKSVRGGGGGGFGAPATKAPSSNVLARVPPSAEVVFAVSPGARQMSALEDFCSEQGLDRLVVLLNCRDADLPADQQEFVNDEFDYIYAFVTEPAGADGSTDAADTDGATTAPAEPTVLWRAFPDDWALARKPKIGPPKTLLEQDERPSEAEVRKACAAAGGAGAGGVLDAIGGLFGGQ